MGERSIRGELGAADLLTRLDGAVRLRARQLLQCWQTASWMQTNSNIQVWKWY